MTEAPKSPNGVPSLYDRIPARVKPLGGVDFELPPRKLVRDPPHFDEAVAAVHGVPSKNAAY
jgi:hypothetical protein